MAPILFLFLFQAMMDTLETKWSDRDDLMSFRRHRDTKNKVYGRVCRQSGSAAGKEFSFNNVLFVDDAACIFGTRKRAEEAAREIYLHMRRFGLLMHVGMRDESGKRLTKSKTEAMFIPANKPENGESPVPSDLHFGDNHYVAYTKTFKYLGSQISDDLTDHADIKHRIRSAKNQLGAMKKFFGSTADIRTKRMMLQAIPLNTAIYGCESWSLHEEHRRKLSSFWHGGIRKALGINMHHVEHHRIRNEHLRNHIKLDDVQSGCNGNISPPEKTIWIMDPAQARSRTTSTDGA